jgi:hypothetical protein
MKEMADACYHCGLFFGCYIDDFNRCPKIEAATAGLGVPNKPVEPESYIENIPFGVYMGLKHILGKVKR